MGASSTQKTTDYSPYSQGLAREAKDEFAVSDPIIKTLGAQYLEALRTGGVNSFIPWLTRAIDSVRQAGSQSMEQVRQQLARTGLGRSSEGSAILAQTGQEQANTTALTPSQMIMQFIGGAGNFAGNVASLGSRNLATAAQFNNTRTTTSTPSFWDQFQQAVGVGQNLGHFLADPGGFFGSSGSSPTASSGAAPDSSGAAGSTGDASSVTGDAGLLTSFFGA